MHGYFFNYSKIPIKVTNRITDALVEIRCWAYNTQNLLVYQVPFLIHTRRRKEVANNLSQFLASHLPQK